MKRAKLVDMVARAGRRFNQAIRYFQQRRASIDEVERLDPQEATRIADDLGVSANELRALAGQHADSAELLTRRMAAIELDPGRVDLAVMRDLQRCCSLCRDKGLCIHELEDQPRNPTWPAYCANEQTLAALTHRADDRTLVRAQPTIDASIQSKQ